MHGPWIVEYDLEDGGRLARLSYDGYDLLTGEPAVFRPPQKDYGEFEKRPVYGYDDCFPTIGKCEYPGSGRNLPDHGEACWLQWELTEEPDGLTFEVASELTPLVFKRKMTFTPSSLVWSFEVSNRSDRSLPFQHSMHSLLRPEEIVSMELPEFASAYDWNRKQELSFTTPSEVEKFLSDLPHGSVEMIFLRGVRGDKYSWSYSNGTRIEADVPFKYFPTLGIWWNKGGYPDEEGLARSECAFEPIAGNTAILGQGYAEGNCLTVGGNGKVTWEIQWKVTSTS